MEPGLQLLTEEHLQSVGCRHHVGRVRRWQRIHSEVEVDEISKVPTTYNQAQWVGTTDWSHLQTVVGDRDLEMMLTASAARKGNVTWLVHTRTRGFLSGMGVVSVLSLLLTFPVAMPCLWQMENLSLY